MVTATLAEIAPRGDYQHGIDAGKMAALAAILDDGWPEDMPPVLVVEDEGNGHIVLDGHHRIEAARRADLPRIPAYLVSIADYCRLLDEHFGGSTPGRLADLDDYITLPTGGTYTRED